MVARPDKERDEAPEEEHEEPGIIATIRGPLGLTLLTWSVAASCLLHGSFFVTAFVGNFRPGSADLDVEWMKSFEDLESLGHGSSGRFAELDEASFQTAREEEKPPTEEPPPEEEPTPEPAEEPPPEPEPPKPREKKPTSETTTVTEAKPVPKSEAKPPEPKKPTTPREIYSEGALPGLDRAGPNGLPAMEKYGPGNAVLTALVRLDRIRGTEFEGPTRRLIEAVPDYRILLEGTEVDPVRHLDSMFMASADPVYLDETFLAVRHDLGRDGLKARLDRRFEQQIPWTSHQGYPVRRLVPDDSKFPDPRQVMLAGTDLALVVRPEWRAKLTAALPPESELVAGVDVSEMTRSPSLLDGLAHIERAADRADTVVLLSAMGASFSLPGIGRIAFEGAKVEIADITAPRLTADIAFKTPAQADAFARRCPSMKKKAIDEAPFGTGRLVTMLVERLECRSEGHFVAIRGQYTAAEAQRVMKIVTPFVPRPESLEDLPPGPPRPPAEEKPAPSTPGLPETPAPLMPAVDEADAGNE